MSVKRQNVTLELSDSKIKEPITKFGGQPNWVEEPDWPTSKLTGKPLHFIAQVKLSDTLHPGLDEKVAYIFLNEDEGVSSYNFNSGENAVIIQSKAAHKNGTLTEKTGPTFSENEYFVELEETKDLDFISEDLLYGEEVGEDKTLEFLASVQGEKLGGVPGFVQSDDFPNNDASHQLIAQFSQCKLPFNINIGEEGIVYVFSEKDGAKGYLTWQC